MRDSFDGGDVLGAHQRELLFAYRAGFIGAAEHGGLDGLWLGDGEPEPAWICGIERGVDTTRRAGELWKRLFAGDLSGIDF